MVGSMLLAQEQRQQRRNFDPTQMANREKEKVYEKLAALTDDQKAIIDVIYENYATSFAEARKNMTPGDREGMRESMMKVRKEKDDSMKEILTAEQFTEYETLLEELRKNRRRGFSGS